MINIQASIFVPKVIKANILLIHGMCEHKERYTNFARELAKNGFMVYTYNQIGHGEENKDSLGYFGDNGYLNLVETAHNLCVEIRKENDYPTFIFAHSMGSIVARGLIKRYPTIIDGAILSGAPNYTGLVLFARFIMKGLCVITGKKTKLDFIYSMIVNQFNKKIQDSKTKFDWLSYNEENVKSFMDDEYCGFTFTNSGFYDLVDGLADIHKGYDVKNKELPILFVAGEDDVVTGLQKGLDNSVDELKKAGYENVELKVFKNARHEIIFENIKDINIFITNWLSNHCQ